MASHSLSIAERPAVLRDRDHIYTATARAILALEAEKVVGQDSLRHLANTLIRHLAAHGVMLKTRRSVGAPLTPAPLEDTVDMPRPDFSQVAP
jgi:hypothetical protein